MNDQTLFYIRIQAPVHIGCDEVYEPMSFVVAEEVGELISFDSLDFFRTLSAAEKTRFSEICREGSVASLLKLYQFMRGKKMEGHDVVVCRGFIEHYRNTLAMKATDRNVQNELNRFSIARTAFNEHDNLPYLPGSAIKGALRTAYLNALAKKDNSVRYEDPRKSKNAAQQLERGLLHYRELEKDPFRLLKISDFLPMKATTAILYGINEKKRLSNSPARGPYQILEVIEPGSLFAGTITAETRYAKEAGIAQPLTRESLFKSADSFYSNEKKREEEEFKEAGLPPFFLDRSDGAIPLRLGRHSGAESVTIEGHRYIRIMGAKGQSSYSPKGANTFWLASDVSKNWNKNFLKPFGWVSLGILNDEMYSSYKKMSSAASEASRQPVTGSARMPPPDAAQSERTAEKPATITEIWNSAYLNWSPGNQVLTATFENKKATIIGKGLVPEVLHKNLFEKRKTVMARVEVEAVGNSFKIIKIEAVDVKV